MSEPADERFLRTFPKVELHCHLEGSLPVATFLELATRHDVTVPSTDPEHAYDFDSFLGFLDLLGLVCRSMVTADDFAVATHASLVQAASDSIRYREMFWNATNHPGVPYETQLEGIVRGIDSARADTGIDCRLLPAINRRQSPEDAVELVRQVASNAHPYVVGISMDDDEDSGPPELFVDAFALAAEHGLHRTAHAGELGSAANVATSLNVSINTDDPTMIPTAIGDEYVGAAAATGASLERMLRCTLDGIDAFWVDDDVRDRLRAEVLAATGASIDAPTD